MSCGYWTRSSVQPTLRVVLLLPWICPYTKRHLQNLYATTCRFCKARLWELIRTTLPQRGITRPSPRLPIYRVALQHTCCNLLRMDFGPMPAPQCSTDVQASRELGFARRQDKTGPTARRPPPIFGRVRQLWEPPPNFFGGWHQTRGPSAKFSGAGTKPWVPRQIFRGVVKADVK